MFPAALRTRFRNVRAFQMDLELKISVFEEREKPEYWKTGEKFLEEKKRTNNIITNSHY